PMPIRLKAVILSKADKTPVPYAHIVNNRTHGGTITNASGFFTLDMLNVDSLTMSSMGFFKETFSVPANYHPDSVVTFLISPVSFAIPQVNVTGEKPTVNIDGVPSGKPVDIDPELRGDAFNEKPPVVAAFFNPVSFWYYYLNKKEKQKREVRKAMALEKNWEMHSQNYNKEVVMSLTGLNDAEADTFMIWFNSLDVLPYTSTEYEVRSSIRQYFEVYKSRKIRE
ncbi:MAG: hypothetical protein JW833_09885, partial [Prolixibacteraceae bacterium]|nr:hypothetical protein [Prolixibacteraceae bacterium]